MTQHSFIRPLREKSEILVSSLNLYKAKKELLNHSIDNPLASILTSTTSHQSLEIALLLMKALKIILS